MCSDNKSFTLYENDTQVHKENISNSLVFHKINKWGYIS